MAKRPRKLNKYRSGFEERTAKFMRELGIKFDYESITIKFKVPETTHRYKPDFVLKNGNIIECKGKLDSAARKKMALVKEQHPELPIKILFMRDQPIAKGSETMYSDWAKKLGYDFAFKEIPTEWLK